MKATTLKIERKEIVKAIVSTITESGDRFLTAAGEIKSKKETSSIKVTELLDEGALEEIKANISIIFEDVVPYLKNNIVIDGIKINIEYFKSESDVIETALKSELKKISELIVSDVKSLLKVKHDQVLENKIAYKIIQFKDVLTVIKSRNSKFNLVNDLYKAIIGGETLLNEYVAKNN